MLLFISPSIKKSPLANDFNTSHVTVYHLGDKVADWTHEFQYISCYCLSSYSTANRIFCHISIHLMLLFIPERMPPERQQSYFNTSHVTVYR